MFQHDDVTGAAEPRLRAGSRSLARRRQRSHNTDGSHGSVRAPWPPSPSTSRALAPVHGAPAADALLRRPRRDAVPDSVIDAVAALPPRLEREPRAGLTARAAAPRRLFAKARLTRGARSSAAAGGDDLRREHDTLNFALTRAAGRDVRAGDEILVTQPRPRRQRPRPGSSSRTTSDLRCASSTSTTTRQLDFDDLERKLTDRTRVVAFPLASNAVGTLTDVAAHRRRSRRAPARSPGPMPCTTARTGRSTSPTLGVDVLALLAVQVLRPASRARLRPRERRGAVAHVQGAAAPSEPSDTASRRARSRTSSSPASSRRSSTSSRSAGSRSRRGSARSDSGSSTGCRTE